jgi:uncharacterized membrane protein
MRKSEPTATAGGPGNSGRKLVERLVLFAAALGSGIVGVFFFDLARISAAQAMSSTVVVINSNFKTPFLGTAMLCVFLMARSLFLWNQPAAKYALAAAMVFLLGCVAVTMLLNVSLSTASAEPATDASRLFWSAYVPAWNAYNHVRSAAGMLSAALFIGALCRR